MYTKYIYEYVCTMYEYKFESETRRDWRLLNRQREGEREIGREMPNMQVATDRTVTI